jgi:hypothetical protein
VNPDFRWRGRDLRLYFDMYNLTHLNERAVELAVVGAWADRWAHHRLEVGNVVGHYDGLAAQLPRTVVDRYEQATGVINCDVFDIGGWWDEIIAISTMEHVRWDEDPREPGGSQRAIEHLRGLLAPGGRMLVTVPTGHNPPLDDWLRDGLRHDPNVTLAIYGRTGVAPDDGWAETTLDDVRPYGATQAWAEAVWIIDVVEPPE